LDWTLESREHQASFCEAWRLINAINSKWGYSAEANLMLRKAEYISDWLTQTEDGTGQIELFHSLNEPLIDQLARRLQNEQVQRLTIVTPFIDSTGAALATFHKQFHPRLMRLVLQNEKAVGTVRSLTRLRGAGVPLQVYPYEYEERYLHAKIYLFETGNDSYLVTGSANCTRAAWLENTESGNLEVMLLRKGDRSDFDYLLDGRIGRAFRNLEQINLKPHLKQLPPQTRLAELLDVTFHLDKLAVKYRVADLPESVPSLVLRFSTSFQHMVPLTQCHRGDHELVVELPPEIIRRLAQPISCSIAGLDEKGKIVDLRSNELWITNSDRLRYESTRITEVDPTTAGILGGGVVTSNDKWNDLYSNLMKLVELDVASLKHHGVTYIKGNGRNKRTGRERGEREVTILAVDETEEAIRQKDVVRSIFKESAFSAWFDHVQNSLAPSSGLSPGNYGGQGQDPPVTKRKTVHRQPPPPDVAIKFIGLTRRYIRALKDPEYKETATIYHLLSYFVIFHRIAWILESHQALTLIEYLELAGEINGAFFGELEDNAPVRCPTQRHHIQSVWAEEWQETQALSFALVTALFALQNLAALPAELGTSLSRRALKICACGTVIVGWRAMQGGQDLLSPAGPVFDCSESKLAPFLAKFLKTNLKHILTGLERWQDQAIAGQNSREPELSRDLAARATADYGMAAYDIARQLQNIEAQQRICTELPFWLREVSRNEEAAELENDLLALLALDGDAGEMINQIYEQAKRLFFDKAYQDARSKLHQALTLASANGRADLSVQIQHLLENVEFFIRLES
jgi:HKD family nuclease